MHAMVHSYPIASPSQEIISASSQEDINKNF